VLSSTGAAESRGSNKSFPEESVDEPRKQGEGPSAGKPTVLPPRLLLQLVVWMGAFLFLYVGCETGYGNLLATYAVQQLQFSVRRGADITLAFWSAFAAGRFAGIFASMWLSPGTMVRVDLAVCCATLVGLVLFQHSEIALWVGSALYGVAVATVYPSAMAWMSARVELGGKVRESECLGGVDRVRCALDLPWWVELVFFCLFSLPSPVAVWSTRAHTRRCCPIW
jgi:fucose permease